MLFLNKESLKDSKKNHYAISSYIHARLLQVDPFPVPGEGQHVQAQIATPMVTCVPIQSHCQGAAGNQRAQPLDWTIALLSPRTNTPDPGHRENDASTFACTVHIYASLQCCILHHRIYIKALLAD